MGIGVDEIVTNLINNYPVAPYLFEVRIFGGGTQADATQEIMFSCAEINVPGISIGHTADKRYGTGLMKNYPSSKEFTEINCTMYETEGSAERQYFVDWMSKIFDKATGRFKFYNNFVKTINIVQLDRQGNKVYEANIMEAWPSNIGQLDKAYASTGQLSTFSVNFQFYQLNEVFYDKTLGPRPFNPSDILGSILRG